MGVSASVGYHVAVSPPRPPAATPLLPSHPALYQHQQRRLDIRRSYSRNSVTTGNHHPALDSSQLLSIILSYCTTSDWLTRCTLVSRKWYCDIHTHCTQTVADPQARHYLRMHSVQALQFLQQHRISSITATQQTLLPHYNNFNQLILAHPFITSVSIDCSMQSVLPGYRHHSYCDPSDTVTQLTDLRCSTDPLFVYESLASQTFYGIDSLMYHGLLLPSYFASEQYQRVPQRRVGRGLTNHTSSRISSTCST